MTPTNDSQAPAPTETEKLVNLIESFERSAIEYGERRATCALSDRVRADLIEYRNRIRSALLAPGEYDKLPNIPPRTVIDQSKRKSKKAGTK